MFGEQARKAAITTKELMGNAEGPKNVLEVLLRFIMAILNMLNRPGMMNGPAVMNGAATESQEKVPAHVDGLTDTERDILREFASQRQEKDGAWSYNDYLSGKEALIKKLVEQIDVNTDKLGTVTELLRQKEELLEQLTAAKKLRNKRERQCEYVNSLLSSHANRRDVRINDAIFEVDNDLGIRISTYALDYFQRHANKYSDTHPNNNDIVYMTFGGVRLHLRAVSTYRDGHYELVGMS